MRLKTAHKRRRRREQYERDNDLIAKLPKMMLRRVMTNVLRSLGGDVEIPRLTKQHTRALLSAAERPHPTIVMPEGRTEFVRVVTKRGEYISPHLEDWKLFVLSDDVVMCEELHLTPFQIQSLMPSTASAETYIERLRKRAGVTVSTEVSV